METIGIRRSTEDGLAVSQIALAHQHRLLSGVSDGDSSHSQVEGLRLCQHISRQCRPRGLNELRLDTQTFGNLPCYLDAEAPVGAIGFTERQRPVVTSGSNKQGVSRHNLSYLSTDRCIRGVDVRAGN